MKTLAFISGATMMGCFFVSAYICDFASSASLYWGDASLASGIICIGAFVRYSATEGWQ